MHPARVFFPLLRSASAALLLGAPLISQSSPQTIPQGYLGSNLTGIGGNSWPFNNGNATFRTMFVYDGKQIKHAGPILITRLRFKASSATFNFKASTYNNTTIRLATCPTPQSHTNISTTYAKNLGKDVKVIFKGNFKSQTKSKATGIWFIDIPLKTAFLYDKSKGDLTFDFQRLGTKTGGSTTSQAYKNGASSITHGGRIYGSGTLASGRRDTGTGIVELTYTPAKGLFSDFTASPARGPGPLKVQFTDKTFTSNGPIKTWAWDFNGDNTIDSTKQNPVWTYAKAGWDAQYDVTLTTTDGTNPASKVTKKTFITVDPSNAIAVDFGRGSTNKPVPTPLGQPANTSHFSSPNAVRGFFFVAPTTFVITGFEAPNTFTPKQTNQTVTLYVLAKAPSTSYTAKSADVKFHGTGKANTILKPAKPIVVIKGQWVAILGACHGSTSTSSHRNSYGTGPHKTTILGQQVTLTRLWMNSDHRKNKGLGIINQSSGVIGRNWIHVVGNTTVPSMTTIGAPKLGSTPRLNLQAKIAGAQGGIIFMGAGRLPTPISTQFGNLLVKPPYFLSVFVTKGTGQIPLPVPSDNVLKGIKLDFQGMVFNLTTSTFGTTNGTEWFLGK